MTKILIIGASSYVGAKYYDDFKGEFEVVGTYFSHKLFPDLLQLDLTNQTEVDAVVNQVKPDVIVHVAANASSGTVAENPKLSEKLNLDGTKYLLQTANESKSKFIYISSFAAIQANNLYGQLKKEAEDFIVENAQVPYAILRPSVIFGLSPNAVNDRPFNRLLKNITEKTEAVYDNSWKFQPTYLQHLADVTREIIDREVYGHLLHVTVPTLHSRYSIAKDLLEELGIVVKSEDQGKKADEIVELSELEKLGLTKCDYEEMIVGIRKELVKFSSSYRQ